MQVPKTTEAVLLPAYNKNLIRAMLSLKTAEVELPQPAGNQLVVKMEASPCNPSDIAFMQGTYNIVKELPAVPGFEGAGTVVATGEECRHMEGKRVSVFLQEEKIGCWSQFIIVDADNCIVLDSKIDLLQAATLSINPLTALGMFEVAEKRGSDTIILDAAGGQVPQFVRVMAAKNGMEVINIFRKRSSIQGLEFSGTYVNLFTEDEDFEKRLAEACQGKKNVTALDAVGGIFSGTLFNALPENSHLVVYGGLSNEAVGNIDTIDLIFNNKSIRGFNLNHYVADLKKNKDFDRVTKRLMQMVIDGEIKTRINATFDIHDVVKGLRTYIKNMSAGKVVFLFD